MRASYRRITLEELEKLRSDLEAAELRPKFFVCFSHEPPFPTSCGKSGREGTSQYESPTL